jgi:hypothetical protein
VAGNTSAPSFSERKAAGDGHEHRVREELERRGWTVSPYGQVVLADPIRRALQASQSRKRWDADLVAAHGSTVCLIDAKSSMRGEDAWTYHVSRKALRAGRDMAAFFDLPLYYVFANLGVATPTEVMQFCRLTCLGEAGGYVSFGSGLLRPFDDVFGGHERLAGLRLAA